MSADLDGGGEPAAESEQDQQGHQVDGAVRVRPQACHEERGERDDGEPGVEDGFDANQGGDLLAAQDGG